jgi:hypothetical protein
MCEYLYSQRSSSSLVSCVCFMPWRLLHDSVKQQRIMEGDIEKEPSLLSTAAPFV